ncbi:hypothetical protein [Bradyrhizobium sp. SZCCHNR3118]|uniref:hypothetical protein n=1 Tax=Bradyrhizobium sp. SZCCHNR3118 TaxID=3057468 RepID=UPI00291662E2|nr:hypothetical protein [Bradyrhizobium sp. SZCCHNR3118]
MTKVSQSYYSTAVEHRDMPGCYMASFASPGEAALWVTGPDAKPKVFTSAIEAELAGFRVMASRLNRARDTQRFEMKGYRSAKANGRGIKAFRVEERKEEHTVESVFGSKK